MLVYFGLSSLLLSSYALLQGEKWTAAIMAALGLGAMVLRYYKRAGRDFSDGM